MTFTVFLYDAVYLITQSVYKNVLCKNDKYYQFNPFKCKTTKLIFESKYPLYWTLSMQKCVKFVNFFKIVVPMIKTKGNKTSFKIKLTFK
jgi:hypothetical protein